jgi:hypothetical protein
VKNATEALSQSPEMSEFVRWFQLHILLKNKWSSVGQWFGSPFAEGYALSGNK